MSFMRPPGFTNVAALSPAAGVSLSMSYTPVTSGTYNVAYTGATPSTSGGTPPYTYSIQAGTLPTGITLNTSTGVISGTDSTDSGGHTSSGLVLRVTDSAGSPAHIDSSSWALAIAAGGGANNLALDGTPQIAAYGTPSVVFSNSLNGSLIFACAGHIPANITQTINDHGLGLTWTDFLLPTSSSIQIAYAVAATTLTSQTISCSGANVAQSFFVFGVSGQAASPFDGSAATGALGSTSYSSTNAKDMIFAILDNDTSGHDTGYTNVGGGVNYFVFEHSAALSSTVSSFTPTFGGALTDPCAIFGVKSS